MTACVSTSTGTTKTPRDSSKNPHIKNTNEPVKLAIEGVEKQNRQVLSQRSVHVA